MSAALDTLRVAVTVALVAVGSFFLLVGTLGLLRLPDVYNRLHATSKATTLGAASVFLAGFVHFGPGGAGLTSLVGIVFLFLTAPTGGHMISRSAHRLGVPFVGRATWPGEDAETDGVEEADAADGVEEADAADGVEEPDRDPS